MPVSRILKTALEYNTNALIFCSTDIFFWSYSTNSANQLRAVTLTTEISCHPTPDRMDAIPIMLAL